MDIFKNLYLNLVTYESDYSVKYHVDQKFPKICLLLNGTCF
jgi:hypothetical protein